MLDIGVYIEKKILYMVSKSTNPARDRDSGEG